MSDGTPVIEVERLTRCYGERTAVDDVSFTVGRGEVVGFLGPNGAGKSTTMRVLTGYLPATSGSDRISGCDVVEESREARRRVGYLPEQVPLYPELRVAEYLRYRGRLKELGGSRLRERVAAVMQQCALIDRARSLIGSLSKGYRQRVGLADALLHEPDLLVLDEPTSGLDPHQVRQVREINAGLAGRHTVLLSTHILSEVELTCSRVLILHRGRVVASDTTEGLRGRRGCGGVVRLELASAAAGVVSVLERLPGVRSVREGVGDDAGWSRFDLEAEPGCDPRGAVFRTAVAQGWEVRELSGRDATLEDVFVQLTASEEGGRS